MVGGPEEQNLGVSPQHTKPEKESVAKKLAKAAKRVPLPESIFPKKRKERRIKKEKGKEKRRREKIREKERAIIRERKSTKFTGNILRALDILSESPHHRIPQAEISLEAIRLSRDVIEKDVPEDWHEVPATAGMMARGTSK
ncbi:MAG TPA: hypothetical protein ENI23_17165, partial [bacterium]|nr:hypothetical protein [bacterium]